MILAYIGLAITAVLAVGFVGGMIVATLLDYIHYRKNRLFIELSRDHNKPKRPAAK